MRINVSAAWCCGDKTGNRARAQLLVSRGHTILTTPTTDHFRSKRQSIKIHVIAPVHPARLVTRNAIAALRFAPRADPALKPNHPNQRKTVPSITLEMLWGRCVLITPLEPVPSLGPRMIEYARAPIPLEISTGPPPAKSRTPHLNAHPVGFQTQHA